MLCVTIHLSTAAAHTPEQAVVHVMLCHAVWCHRYEEDEERRERFYYSMLGGGGAPPTSACPDVARLVVQQHFNCPSAWCILPLQVVWPVPAVALGIMRLAVCLVMGPRARACMRRPLMRRRPQQHHCGAGACCSVLPATPGPSPCGLHETLLTPGLPLHTLPSPRYAHVLFPAHRTFLR